MISVIFIIGLFLVRIYAIGGWNTIVNLVDQSCPLFLGVLRESKNFTSEGNVWNVRFVRFSIWEFRFGWQAITHWW